MAAGRPGTKDGAMNETQDSPGGTTATPPPPGPPPTGEQTGPRVSHEDMRDLRRLRRSVSERKIAGVAGGVGRHLDVDPTVIRVLFVVASFFGGAGLLLYGALWLLVPEDGRDSAAVPTRDDTRKILLIVVGVVAALIVLGHAWGNWWFGPGWPIGLVAIAAVLYLVSRDRNRAAATPAPYGPYSGSYPTATYAATYAAPGGTVTAPVPDTGATAGGEPPAGAMPPAPPRPSWSPPPYVAPPPRPRRQGLKLFWPTLALVAIALGILGLYENAGNTVVDAAYPALALAITGVMLVVGAFVGRPGGLILIGIVSALTMAAGSATGGFDEGRTVTYSPGTASDVRSSYEFQNGEVTLDLTQVSDPAALDGQTIKVDGGAGRIAVVVPSDMVVNVQADIHVVGGYDIGDNFNGGGFDRSVDTTFGGTTSDPTINLDLDLRVGEIDVRQP